jgi:hypothetical protein
VLSDKKILKISFWTLAAMLDFKSAPKTLVEDHPMNISGKFG